MEAWQRSRRKAGAEGERSVDLYLRQSSSARALSPAATWPLIELARFAAFDQAQLEKLEVLLQLRGDRLRRGPALTDEEVARVPGKPRRLDALEGVSALVERVERPPAACRFEQFEQGHRRV